MQYEKVSMVGYPPFSLLDGVAATSAALTAFIGCAVFGAVAGTPQERLREADAVVGLGIATGIITFFGTMFPIPLSVPAGFLAMAALSGGVMLLRQRDAPGGTAMWIVLAALVPLLLLVATMPASHWDELHHWLLVALYFQRFDSFPRPDLPPSPAFMPAYPQAGPLFVWLVSLLARHWTESGGALLAVLLLGSFVPILIAVVREVRCDLFTSYPLATRAALSTAGLFLVLPLNPSFDRTFSLTALADIPTATATGTGTVLGWLMLERLRDGEQVRARTVALQFGIVMAYLINLKQANPALAALLVGSVGLLVLRDPLLRSSDLLRLLPRMLLPGTVVCGAWRIYVGLYLPAGEIAPLPFEAWRVHQIPEILGAMAKQATVHPIHFALLSTLTILGFTGLVRLRGPVDRLLTIVAMLSSGYIAFLGFIYVVSGLSDPEALRAAEFWRYATHLGLVGITGGTAVVAQNWPEHRYSGRWAQTPAVVAPVAVSLALLLVGGRLVPPVEHLVVPFRSFGRELAEVLPEGARVAIINPWDCDLMVQATIYELLRPDRDDRNLRVADGNGLVPGDFMLDSRALASLDELNASYIAVLNIPSFLYCEKAEVEPLAAMEMFLLARSGDGWRQIGQWRRECWRFQMIVAGERSSQNASELAFAFRRQSIHALMWSP
jgi:hypothetical protein